MRKLGGLGYYRSSVAVFNGVLIGVVLAYVVVRAAISGGLRLQPAVPAQVSDIVLFAVLTGLLAYGTLECVKRVRRVRGEVHYVAARGRMGKSACDELNRRLGSPRGVAAAFDLPTDQFAAQVSEVMVFALTPSPIVPLG